MSGTRKGCGVECEGDRTVRVLVNYSRYQEFTVRLSALEVADLKLWTVEYTESFTSSPETTDKGRSAPWTVGLMSGWLILVLFWRRCLGNLFLVSISNCSRGCLCRYLVEERYD